MPSADTVTVLVAEDERATADAYARVLDGEYDVRVAYSGEQALEKIDDDVDIALLDRRMPDRSGAEVLEAIRDAGYDCRVAMVTAVSPDYDILDMEIDAYLHKPVGAEDLEETVAALVDLAEYEQLRRHLSSARVKRNVLEVEKDERELAESGEFDRLQARIDEFREAMTAIETAHPTYFE